MINFDDVTEKYIKEHNLNWPEIADSPCRILKLGDSGSGKFIKFIIYYFTNQILTKFIYMLKIHMK